MNFNNCTRHDRKWRMRHPLSLEIFCLEAWWCCGKSGGGMRPREEQRRQCLWLVASRRPVSEQRPSDCMAIDDPLAIPVPMYTVFWTRDTASRSKKQHKSYRISSLPTWRSSLHTPSLFGQLRVHYNTEILHYWN